MYLTAHRAQEPNSKQTAIHVFVHLHEDDAIFGSGMTDEALLKRVTEAEPGRLVDRDLTLPAGGNTVLSFVDVVAPDNTPQAEILNALSGYRACVGAEPPRRHERFGSVLVSFGAVFGLQGAELREYDNLREGLEAVIQRFYARMAG